MAVNTRDLPKKWKKFLIQVLVAFCAETVTAALNPSGHHVCRNSNYVPRQPSGLIVESYCQPIFKPYFVSCGYSQRCVRYRTVYHVGYRKRYVPPQVEVSTEPQFACCRGWRKSRHNSHSCTQPICAPECQNGGQCLRPETCACQSGWTGRSCELDINECEHNDHGCTQLCKNNNGSYACGCHSGFSLTADGRTCQVCLSCIPEFQFVLDRVEALERELGQMRKDHNDSQQLQQNDNPSAPTALPVLEYAMVVRNEHISQIERIPSLSEQISMLEERLDGCTCRKSSPQRSPSRRYTPGKR